MFLNKLQKDNPQFLQTVVQLHQEGILMPDSYVIDLEQFRENAAAIKAAADEKDIRLYFMLKQLGRNPVLAKLLMDMGYAGAVVVDFKEALVMMRHNIPIGNIGHLVQIPEAMVEQIVAYGPEVITVYTADKVHSISQAARKLGKTQCILVRVVDGQDMIYSGQTAGITLEDLPAFLAEIRDLPGIQVAGITSFPCFLYDEKADDIVSTPNLRTVLKAEQILKKHGIRPTVINAPSTTSVRTLALMAEFGCNSGEPGHGLTGTTPAHAHHDLPEKSCVAYVSEISHNFGGFAYCYGGGFYRRGHVENALVGRDGKTMQAVKIIPPSAESIDYHFGLSQQCSVGESVVMAFRFQIFVTRSDVVLLDGVRQGSPRIVGVYDSQGNRK